MQLSWVCYSTGMDFVSDLYGTPHLLSFFKRRSLESCAETVAGGELLAHAKRLLEQAATGSNNTRRLERVEGAILGFHH